MSGELESECWILFDANAPDPLPADDTPGDGPWCSARCRGFMCTERPEHVKAGAPHRAGDGFWIVAVWPVGECAAGDGR